MTAFIGSVRGSFLPGGYVTLTWGWETEEYTFRLGQENAAIEGWLERRLGGSGAAS